LFYSFGKHHKVQTCIFSRIIENFQGIGQPGVKVFPNNE